MCIVGLMQGAVLPLVQRIPSDLEKVGVRNLISKLNASNKGVLSRGCGSTVPEKTMEVSKAGIKIPIEGLFLVTPSLNRVMAASGADDMARKPWLVEDPKVAAMGGRGVLKTVDALNRLRSSFIMISKLMGCSCHSHRANWSSVILSHDSSDYRVVNAYNINHRPHGGCRTIEGKIYSRIGSSQMVIAGRFGDELAVFGEGKLPLLDLGMNLGSFLIFLCIDLR
ncbi:hypothetical protein TIFTF001_037805 [Ficus carica]|uniref:Uncharacterized protein n=1 Tax=Ficus carica TaxID=3494 RepID=A0AA88E7P6_FICCA|nr:hypothetical protein TIFTF001_037805 [Ficus carica]